MLAKAGRLIEKCKEINREKTTQKNKVKKNKR